MIDIHSKPTDGLELFGMKATPESGADMLSVENEVESNISVGTQRGMVLRWLKEEGHITPLDAMREFGCFRLGARIHELKKAGYGIINEWEESVNRYGQTVRYARYRLL